MKIVADENIPLVNELFGGFGELLLLPGRAIDAAAVQNAEALLVRSVTRVDAALVSGSRLRFVGSATIGTDHVELTTLQSAGIAFANAPGCNANAVAEYVLASLLVLAERGRFRPGVDVIGILGYGNVGKRLASKLTALNWPFRVCDPPLAELRQISNDFVSAAACLDCDALSLHVPLTRVGAGAHPTWHWLNETTLAQTRAKIVINSCRGPVVDNLALLNWLQADTTRSAVLDVWENEPNVPDELLQRIDLATPHIAGHSREGKCNGSFMIHHAFCQQFGFDAAGAQQLRLPVAGNAVLQSDGAQAALLNKLLACYDPRRDDQAMRAALSASSDRRTTFDQLRKNYPERRELLSWQFTAETDIAKHYRALTSFV